MLQTYTAPQGGLYEEHGQAFDLGRILGIFRRRILFFAVPFVVLLITGSLVVAIQRPIYHSEGRILVESPQIPTDLVEPTVQAAATERIQAIQQRLMSRDSLMPIVEKFNLFPSQRQYMSGTQILDLMRQRAQIALVDLNAEIGNLRPAWGQNKTPAVAFTVSFDYERPDLAAKVANELLTSILNDDAQARTNRATETTAFLEREVKRLQGQLDTLNGQIFAIKQHAADPKDGDAAVPDTLKMQMQELTAMKADLIQKSSVYSDEHPAIKALRKRIAALQQQIDHTPKPAAAAAPEQNIDALQQQQQSIEKSLDEESKKLVAARLGESLERNQQAERLQVIEQPAAPQRPIKPNRPKLFAASFALSIFAGLATVVSFEMLDGSIRGSRDLTKLIDAHLLISIPYIPTAGELARRKRRRLMIWIALAIFLLLGIAAAIYVGIEIDFSGLDRSWIDSLTRLTK